MKGKLTEDEINIRVKCGCYATDITELCRCVLTWLCDLKSEKERQGVYKMQIKQQVERAINITTLVCTNVRIILSSHNKEFERSWNEVYDQLIGNIDGAVALCGEERIVSLLHTSFKIIRERIQELQKYKFSFSGLSDIERILSVEQVIQNVYRSVKPMDLSIFFYQALSKVIDQEEREIAKNRLKTGTNEYYNKRYEKK